jgi:hypothetical protein
VIASPAMALDTKFSGQYYVKGYHNSNYTLDDNDSSDSYMTMRLRVQTDFYVSDNLNLTTRFDALDNKRWGQSDDVPNNDNIDWDRAYMTVKGDYGLFNIGRMSGGTWGTSYNDTEDERDRIKYVKGFGDLTVIAIYEKTVEQDEGNLVSDQDLDIYYLAPFYKMENVTFGMLYGYVNDKTFRGTSDEAQYHVFIPYAVGQFGPFGFQGELRYNGFGDREYFFGDDRDIEQLTWNLEGNFSMDMFKFELGWVHVDGQYDETDDIVGYGGAIGDDWEKVWILTGSTDDNTAAALGGQGNLSTTGSSAGGPLPAYGAELYYGGVTVMPMEGLDIGFLVAYAEADDTPSGLDDEYGWEYNLRLNYKIYDNLTYSFIAAYLDAGDYWADSKGIDDDDLEDNLHLYHALSLKF